MKNFIRHTSLFLVFVFVLSLGVFNIPQVAEAATIKTDIGYMTLSRGSIGWDTGTYENQLMLVKPGASLTGLYFGKVYAVYDSAAGGYVVTEKSGLHCSYSKTVASNAVGIAISYQPLTTTGSAFARANWLIWQQIRIGDILTFSGVTVSSGTVNVSGTFGNSDFVSNSKVHVTTVRDDTTPKTGYTGKTAVVLGDSVTAGGGWTETVEIAINGRVINASTPGARTDEGLGYFDSQVAVHNPDIVFIKYAINDCIQYTITSNTLPAYKQNLRDLCQMALDIGALPILITTNNIKIASLNYDRYASFGGLSVYYPQYIQAIRDVAAEYDTFCIDIYSGVWSSLTATDYLIDTVHPKAAGYALEGQYISNYLLNNEDAIIAKVNEVTGETDGMPSADTNFLSASAGGQYMYGTTYPGGSAYYATAYYGDNSNQGGAYFSGKLNDGTYPADGIPNTSNVNWAVFFAGATTPTITLKLSAKAYLNNISLIVRNGTSSGINYVAPVISSIQLSNDGTNFTATAAYTSKLMVNSGLNYKMKLSFNQVLSAKYIRINLATPADRTAIGEVEVWGSTTLPEGAEQPFELIDGSVYNLETGYVSAKGLGLNAQTVKGQFKCDVTVLNTNGATVADTSFVGTGFTVVQYNANGAVLNSVTLVIPGDTNGDGDLNLTDYVVVETFINGTGNMNDLSQKAADLTGDALVSAADILIMELHCNGKATID